MWADLGGIEQFGGFFGLEEAEEHAMGGAGDKVANLAVADERRHGKAESASHSFVGTSGGVSVPFGLGVFQERSTAAKVDGRVGLRRHCHGVTFSFEALKKSI